MARYVIENPSAPDQVDVWWDQPQFVKDAQGKNTKVIKTDTEGRQIYRRCVCRSIDLDAANALNQKIGDTTQLSAEFDNLKTVVQDRHTATNTKVTDFETSLANEVTVRANADQDLQSKIDADKADLAEFKNNYKINTGIGLLVTEESYAGSIIGRISNIESKLNSKYATKEYALQQVNQVKNNATTALTNATEAKELATTATENVTALSTSVGTLNTSVSTFSSRLEALENNSDIGTVTSQLTELTNKDTELTGSISTNASEITALKARCDALEAFINRITNQSISFDGESFDVVVLAPESSSSTEE